MFCSICNALDTSVHVRVGHTKATCNRCARIARRKQHEMIAQTIKPVPTNLAERVMAAIS